jgi:hypothetical protein
VFVILVKHALPVSNVTGLLHICLSVAAAYDLEKARRQSLHPDNSHPYGDCQEAWIRKTEAPGSDRPLRRSRRFPSSFCEAILKRYNLGHPPLCDLARVAKIPPSAPDVRNFVTNRGHGGGNAAPMPTPALARVHDNQCCQGL